MVSEEIKTRIWDAVLDADRCQLYWGLMVRRYERIEFWLTILITVFSTGAVASWFFELEKFGAPGWIWKVLSGAAAITSVILPYLGTVRKTEAMAGFGARYGLLKFEYENLFSRLGKMSDEEALSIFTPIKEKENELFSVEVRHGLSSRMNKKSHKMMLKSRSSECLFLSCSGCWLSRHFY